MDVYRNVRLCCLEMSKDSSPILFLSIGGSTKQAIQLKTKCCVNERGYGCTMSALSAVGAYDDHRCSCSSVCNSSHKRDRDKIIHARLPWL